MCVFLPDHQTPLHLATYLSLPLLVQSLVEKGASLEPQDQDGNTPLHVACQQGLFDCAAELTRNISNSKLAPVLETQNWKGELNNISCCCDSGRLYEPVMLCLDLALLPVYVLQSMQGCACLHVWLYCRVSYTRQCVGHTANKVIAVSGV